MWRDTRAPEAGLLLHLLDQRLEPDAVWPAHEVGADDPRRTTSLLLALRAAEPGRARELVELLAAVAPDPRIAHAYAELASTPPRALRSSEAQPFWKAFGQLLVASIDKGVELRPAIRTTYLLRSASPAYEAGRALEQAHSAAFRLPRTDPLPAARDWAVAMSPVEESAITVLRRAVAEAPHDTHAASVLADALLEYGDPRGELIRLQSLDGPGAADHQPRIEHLLRRHRVAWLGELATVLDLDSVVFERGFPTKGAIGADRALQPPADFLADLRWQTFRALDLRGWEAAPTLIASNRWPALVELRGGNGALLAGGNLPVLRWFEGQATGRQLSEAAVRPLVLELRYAGPPEDFVWRAHAFSRLAMLGVIASDHDTAWLQTAPRLTERFEVVVSNPYGVEARFPKGRREVHLRWLGNPDGRWDEGFRFCAQALRGVQRVEVHVPQLGRRLPSSGEISGHPEVVERLAAPVGAPS